jgi:hypothetical protein
MSDLNELRSEEHEEEVSDCKLEDLNIYATEDTLLVTSSDWLLHEKESQLVGILKEATDYKNFLFLASGMGLHVDAKFNKDWFNLHKSSNQAEG